MKHLKKFNENTTNTEDRSIELTMNDVKNIKHNLGYRNSDDFMKNYSWQEDQILTAKPSIYIKPDIYEGKKIEVFDLYTKSDKYVSELGYAILIDGNISYLIGIYEPHGCDLDMKHGLILSYGHESIVKLWLDNDEFDTINTR